MLTLQDRGLNENLEDDRFSCDYSHIVRRFLSKPARNGNPANHTYLYSTVCDAPAQETKVKRIKEELVRCVWYGKHYKDTPLFTEDALRLEVISPGFWNVEGGPDFHHAEILLDGSGLIKGDVEVHVITSDWDRHGHNKQETYNNVCLHVAMWNDMEGVHVFNEKGRSIPQLVLHKYLDAELDELFERIDTEEYPAMITTNAGPCQKSLKADLHSEWIGRFLDYAGDERIMSKAKRFKQLLDGKTFEQTLYEATMESLGYKNNKTQFLRLASLLPFGEFQRLIPLDSDIKARIRYAQAALFGMAGLLPSQSQKRSRLDAKTTDQGAAYIQEIEDIWRSNIIIHLNKRPMDVHTWRFSGSRPANFPTRRLAAMGHIIIKGLEGGLFRLFIGILEGAESYTDPNKRIEAVARGIESVFIDIFDDYWSYYYTFGGKRLSSPERLIGKDRTAAILINIIIPILLVTAKKDNNIRLENVLHTIYKMHTCLPDNKVTRFMTNRIFGSEDSANKVVYNARRQQGLHQLFTDFCDSDNFRCNRCALFLMLGGGS